MTFIQDTKSTSTLTQDTRTAVGTLSQDDKTSSGSLWSASIQPWLQDFPWLWAGNGQIINLDTRNV